MSQWSKIWNTQGLTKAQKERAILDAANPGRHTYHRRPIAPTYHMQQLVLVEVRARVERELQARMRAQERAQARFAQAQAADVDARIQKTLTKAGIKVKVLKKGEPPKSKYQQKKDARRNQVR